jgi:hypothetical protein
MLTSFLTAYCACAGLDICRGVYTYIEGRSAGQSYINSPGEKVLIDQISGKDFETTPEKLSQMKMLTNWSPMNFSAMDLLGDRYGARPSMQISDSVCEDVLYNTPRMIYRAVMLPLLFIDCFYIIKVAFQHSGQIAELQKNIRETEVIRVTPGGFTRENICMNLNGHTYEFSENKDGKIIATNINNKKND